MSAANPIATNPTREWREWLTFTLFLAPNLVLLAIFAYWPLVQNVALSFTSWDMISPTKDFVGLENWVSVLSSGEFWQIALNTATFTIGSVGLTLVLGLLLALLLNEKLRFRGHGRFFTPTVLSGAAVAVVWFFMFDPNWGILKTALGVVGLPSPRWVTDTHWAMPAVIIVYVWKTVGYAAVIFLAGLQGIPKELYEAARVDGASAWDRFRAVTLPGLAPISFFLLVTTILLSFQSFDIINVMTKGGPVIATTTLLYQYYNEGFVFFHAGNAAVYAVTLFVLMLILTIIQLRYVERRVTYCVITSAPRQSVTSGTVSPLTTDRVPRATATRRKMWSPLGYFAMALAVILVGVPMYWMLLAALKTNQEIFTAPPTWIPLKPTLDNFPAAWAQAPFGNFYVNSLIYTLVSGSAKIIQAVLSAYALAFLRFPRKNLVFVLLLIALMIPDEFTVLPNFLTLAQVGWVNTYQGLLLPGFVSAFGTFLLRQHFLSLPREVMDAARVDGANHLRMLWNVVLPMSRPVLATLVLLTAVQRWNDYLWPLIITNSTEMRPLSVGISLLFAKKTGTEWGVVMAGTLYVVLPVLVLFLLVQRHIVEGIAAGAVKG